MLLRKYDAGGKELWTRPFGTPETRRVTGLQSSDTGVYIGLYVRRLAGQKGVGGSELFVHK
jgi:hypothetical protein